MVNIRKSIGTKLRFEVFKRDKFTCQYCGKKSPDIVLHLDHIEPVAKGGSDEFLNLITSCQECNLGKSDRFLDDNTVVTKQHEQLAELEERRQQMEMMVEWRKGLKDVDAESFDMLVDYINSHFEGSALNDHSKAKLRPVHKKFNFEEVLEAVDISARQYLRWDLSIRVSKPLLL